MLYCEAQGNIELDVMRVECKKKIASITWTGLETWNILVIESRERAPQMKNESWLRYGFQSAEWLEEIL